jgi:hypothetical protein
LQAHRVVRRIRRKFNDGLSPVENAPRDDFLRGFSTGIDNVEYLNTSAGR